MCQGIVKEGSAEFVGLKGEEDVVHGRPQGIKVASVASDTVIDKYPAEVQCNNAEEGEHDSQRIFVDDLSYTVFSFQHIDSADGGNENRYNGDHLDRVEQRSHVIHMGNSLFAEYIHAVFNGAVQ